MSELEVVNQVPVSLSELKDFLDKQKKEKKELNFRENKVTEYLQSFDTIKVKDLGSIKKEITELNVGRLKDKHIIKIIDLAPEDTESLKIILSGENLTLKQEDLGKVVEIIKKHV